MVKMKAHRVTVGGSSGGQQKQQKTSPNELLMLVWAQRWGLMCVMAKMKAQSWWWQQRTVKTRGNEPKQALDARLGSMTAVNVCDGEDGEKNRKKQAQMSS